MANAKLGHPARKLFISQLQECNSFHSEVSQVWKLDLDDGTVIDVQIAWLQGVVMETAEDGDFSLSDNTGLAKIKITSEKLKKFMKDNKTDIKVGDYVMVIGNIIKNGELPVVRAIKVTQITQNRNLYEKMWKLEVVDIQRHYKNSELLV
ncbi:recQ-mediated genome instability protein 2-like [Saccoglossus kowalevskii]